MCPRLFVWLALDITGDNPNEHGVRDSIPSHTNNICIVWENLGTFSDYMSDLRTRFEDGDDACMFFGLHKKLIVTELERMQVHDFS